MSTKDEKYLVLRGKNKDIYFIQKRVSKKVASIIGTDFIKKSLETSDINVAIEKRDSILEELIAHEQSIPANNTPDTQDSPDIDSDINPKYEENGKNTFDVKKIVDIKYFLRILPIRHLYHLVLNYKMQLMSLYQNRDG